VSATERGAVRSSRAASRSARRRTDRSGLETVGPAGTTPSSTAADAGACSLEQVEGFAGDDDRQRADQPIRECERSLTDFGTVLVRSRLRIFPATSARRRLSSSSSPVHPTYTTTA
jgi:hypothetical protein